MRPGYRVAVFTAALAAPLVAQSNRPYPSTAYDLRVWNDQLATWNMSEAQFRFAATHYVGTQKVLRADARHLRQYAPDFLVLHYRLAQALGHSVPSACAPTTNYLQIIHTDNWVQEWPGDANVVDEWFFHWNGQRVFSCSNGHYLADLDDAAWRTWWSGQVVQQLTDNEDDALFADSFSIPNYFGATDWNPNLPAVDPTFENDWAGREHDFTDYMQGVFAGRWKWIPNIGALITSRDPSDWSNLDGAMIEGFAEWGGGNYFAASDWALQLNRVLPLAAAGRILIGQTYPAAASVAERMFVLGTFYLIQGSHTYLNLDTGLDPEWFPEYRIVLGKPLDPLPADVAAYFDAGQGVYVRHFDHGLVVVNPGTTTRLVALGGTWQRITPSGGGAVPADGSEPGSLASAAVTSVSLAAHQAAILTTDLGLLFRDDFETGNTSRWAP
ncbi:MAG: putative glycoside hydrolase [Thermoanaerobaculia bacterium]